MEQLYTVAQVAQKFNVVPLTVRKWFYAGKLRGAKLGRSVRFSESAIQEFVNRSTAKGTE